MFDAANAQKVGTDQGYCLRVVAGASYECTWTTFLPGGQIVVAGPFYDAKDSTLAITGGTGRYRNARGTMDLHVARGRHRVRLRLPRSRAEPGHAPARGRLDRPSTPRLMQPRAHADE